MSGGVATGMRHMRDFQWPRRGRLLLVAAITAALALPGPPVRAQTTAPPISSAAQLFTCCTDPELQDRLFEEAAASGARYVRVDVELHGIFGAAGSSDHPAWDNLDAMIERARRHGVQVLGLIRGTPLWLSSCPQRP